MTIDQKIANVAGEKDLLLLCKDCAETYKSNPKKQLECFAKLIESVYATPKVFETVVRLSDKILDVDVALYDPVIDLMQQVLQTKRVNAENCDYMSDMLKGHGSQLKVFEAARVKVFIKSIEKYKKALQTMDNALSSNRTDAGMTASQYTTKYGVVCSRTESTEHRGVGGSNRAPTTKYGVVRPNNAPTTKYGVVKPESYRR